MPPLGTGKRTPPQNPMGRLMRGPLVYLVLVLLLLWAFMAFLSTTRNVKDLSLNQFEDLDVLRERLLAVVRVMPDKQDRCE